MKTLLYILVLALLFGCASRVKRIDCEAHLKPINAPAPVEAGGARP